MNQMELCLIFVSASKSLNKYLIMTSHVQGNRLGAVDEANTPKVSWLTPPKLHNCVRFCPACPSKSGRELENQAPKENHHTLLNDNETAFSLY